MKHIKKKFLLSKDVTDDGYEYLQTVKPKKGDYDKYKAGDFNEVYRGNLGWKTANENDIIISMNDGVFFFDKWYIPDLRDSDSEYPSQIYRLLHFENSYYASFIAEFKVIPQY